MRPLGSQPPLPQPVSGAKRPPQRLLTHFIFVPSPRGVCPGSLQPSLHMQVYFTTLRQERVSHKMSPAHFACIICGHDIVSEQMEHAKHSWLREFRASMDKQIPPREKAYISKSTKILMAIISVERDGILIQGQAYGLYLWIQPRDGTMETMCHYT